MALLIGRSLLLLTLIVGVTFAGPLPVAGAATGFVSTSAESTYGQEITFRVTLDGTPPERLELLLRFGEADTTFVAPVTPQGSQATYRWDAAEMYVTPNTRIRYQWRATTAGEQELSRSATLLYDDDRPGLDWRTATMGDAVVHWYGNAEAQARHFGDLTSGAARAAEQLLGHQLAGPVDIFVYATGDAFFGALGPGAREWTGAATYPEIRTVFMNLENNSADYLDTVVTHEVTHVVFHDATQNPYHEPARWLNEGLATWAERQNAEEQKATVRADARDGLFAFDAITRQFPTGDRGALLSYAEGATMIDMIIQRFGREAIGRIAAAYRQGATDADALQRGTGIPVATLYADYFRSFGATQPHPVAPDPLPPAIVGKPGSTGAPAALPSAPVASPAPSQAPERSGNAGEWLILVPVALLVAAGLLGARIIQRRTAPRRPG